jgi:hypothetical protein
MKKIIVALCLAATPAGALRAQTAATVYMTLLRQQYDAAKSEFLTAQKNAVLAARAGQTETAYMFARQMDYARAPQSQSRFLSTMRTRDGTALPRVHPGTSPQILQTHGHAYGRTEEGILRVS